MFMRYKDLVFNTRNVYCLKKNHKPHGYEMVITLVAQNNHSIKNNFSYRFEKEQAVDDELDYLAHMMNEQASAYDQYHEATIKEKGEIKTNERSKKTAAKTRSSEKSK